MRYCTKCHAELKNESVFCPSCGTKQYISLKGKLSHDEKLMVINGCKSYKFGLFSDSCTVVLYNNRIVVTKTDGVCILNSAYSQIANLVPYTSIMEGSAGIRISTIQKKNYSLVLPAIYSDSIDYIISMITDLKVD